MIPQRYWDSSAFLGWLNRRAGRYDPCDQIIADAEAGKCQIVTSTITYAEVFYIKPEGPGQPPLLPHEKIKAIRDLFGKSYVVPAELDKLTAFLAREMLFAFGHSHGLKPADALHLATAVRTRQIGRVECFDTWDGPLSSLNGQLVKVEMLQEKDSGADLYIGVPVIAPRLPFRSDASSAHQRPS